jgi:phage terminase large subunit-like protein
MDQEWKELLSLIPGYESEATAAPTDYFDPEQAQLAIDFFPGVLRFIEGERAGDPFELEPWQQAIVAALWGWRREDGTRRYRETFIFVPRKSGKSPMAAGLLLLSIFTDGEQGGQWYAAAASREQAALVYRHLSGMIAREPELAKRSKLYKSFKSVEFPETGGTFRALASDADNLHGLNVQMAVVDELHAHKDGELVDVLVTATGSRLQPLIVYITTSDFDRPSVCNSKHEYASKVRDGIIDDPSFLPCIWEAEPDDDWTDPAIWAKANPNLGVSVKLEYLQRECRRAMAEPAYENTFRRLHLNQRTTTDSKWLSVTAWDECAAPEPELTGIPCYGGLDLSTTTDLSAFVLAFPIEDTVYLKPYFWIPEARLQDRADRVPYAAWARQGQHIFTTPGQTIDYSFVRAKINELATQYSLQELRFDPHNATQLATQLAEEDGLVLTQHRQGYLSMNAPLKELERRILSGTLAHDGSPVLRWNISNTVVHQDAAGNLKLAKDKATERIDGVAAAAMAISGVMAGTEAPNYEVIWL